MRNLSPHITLRKLEKSLFELICLIVSFVAMYIAGQSFYRVGYSGIYVLEIILGLVTLSFYYLSIKRGWSNVLRVPLTIILTLTCAFFWYRRGGFNGPMSVGTIACLVGFIMIAPPKHKWYYFLYSIAILVFLVSTQLYTDWVNTFYIKENISIHYFIFGLAILGIVYLFKTEYDKERKKSNVQKDKLEALNAKLHDTIREKEDVIISLSHAKDKLIESEKMASVGRLTAGLAHELNNPLNYIGGNVKPILEDLEELKQSLTYEQMEQNRPLFAEINNLLNNVVDGSQRAADVITNLLKMSPRALEKEVSRVSLNEIVVRTCSLLQNSHPNVHFWIKKNEKIHILANRTEINQVIINILKNSVDSLSGIAKGKVSIDIYTEGRESIITITDNGPGVPKEIQSKIFDPFYTTKDEGQGTGLGLYISYGIIKKHGGNLRYVPIEKGACFKITLPSFQQSNGRA